jgi:hypothetical protein
MPDGNGERQWQIEMQRRLEALERAHKELEDSFIVMTQLETRMSQVVRQQSEWPANHETRLAESEARLKHIETGLAEATDKINFLIDRETRREGGPESAR